MYQSLMAEEHAHHNHKLWHYALPAALTGVTLAPHILPHLGIQSTESAHDIMNSLARDTTLPINPFGTGLAGGIQEALAQVPWIGGALTSTESVTLPLLGAVPMGALTTLAAVSIIGIGGVLLANWLARHEHSESNWPWSRILRWAALGTSAIIALPSILSGIGAGLVFLTSLADFYTSDVILEGWKSTLGATAMSHGATGGVVTLAITHLLTCGGMLFPMMAGMYLGGSSPSAPAREARVALVECSEITPGQPCRLAFRLTDSSGTPLSVSDLATTHTKKLHTMIVDSSLNEYHHLHPRYDPESGLFITEFIPAMRRNYRVWNEFMRVDDAAPTHVKIDLPRASNYDIPPNIQPTSIASADGVTASIRTQSQGDQGTLLTVSLTDASGQPITDLAPIMGAYAHLAGFSKDGGRFIHCHPLNGRPANLGHMQFHVASDATGPIKFFLQFNCSGQEITIPFGQVLRGQMSHTERLIPAHNGHVHGLAAA